MYNVDPQTAKDFALVAEHKRTVFVINWHIKCTDGLKCVSFPSMNVISLCYLPHSFALAVTLTSIRGRVACFESPPGHNRQLLCGLN